MVEIAREMKPLRTRWQRIVIAIGSNGGGLEKRDAEQLREKLERLSAELDATIAEITAQGVQVKDVERGLVDFPTVIEGRPALLCWHVGEERIGFWHSEDDGFAGRRPL
jgi:hypothetical protein